MLFGRVFPKDQVIPLLQQHGISAEHSHELLLNDISIVEEACERNDLLRGHNDARQGAIINMAFQLGITGLLGFSQTLKYLANKDYANASVEMLDSKWYREDTPGRAKKMSEQILTGEWQ